MYVLVARYSDGCTYQSNNALAVFTDESVAQLVAEALNEIAAKGSPNRDLPDPKHGGFEVVSIDTFAAESESRVQGIVKTILREHFPKT